MSSGEAEEEVAGEGVGEESEEETDHSGTAIPLLCLLIVSLNTVTVESLLGHIHGGFFRPHILLTLIVC